MAQKTFHEQLEEAKSELAHQKEKLNDQKKTASGLEQDLAIFERLVSDADTVLLEYGHTFKDLSKRWRDSEKSLLAKKESIPNSHRKELAEKVGEFEGPLLKEIEERKATIDVLTKTKDDAAAQAKISQDKLQKVQGNFDSLKNTQTHLDSSLKDIEELANQIESKGAESKAADPTTFFLISEVETALDNARVTTHKELKEQMEEAFPQLMAAVRDAREKIAHSEAIQTELENAIRECDALVTGRRAKVLEELLVEAAAASDE